jgi:RimJ/RimL family protein N-acetyltransferase
LITDIYTLLLFAMLASQIRIRGITEEDQSKVYDYACHELIAATTNVPHPYPREAAILFIRESLEKAAIREVFVFAVLADEHFVGLVSIHREPLISINFGIAVPFWNNGYATAAVSEAHYFCKERAGCQIHRKHLSSGEYWFEASDAEKWFYKGRQQAL